MWRGKKMRKIELLLSMLTVTFLLLSLGVTPSLSKPTRSVDRVRYYLIPEQYYPDELTIDGPRNKQGFPSDFSAGTVAWDLDLIDVETVDSSIDGEGIYVAVLDTGLVANWRDFFPEERIATEYGMGFYEVPVGKEGPDDTGKIVKGTFLGKLAHGTHVTSTIIGYSYGGEYVRGVAPKAKIIPVKVLDMYEGLSGKEKEPIVYGTDLMVAAGINYIADLAEREGIKIVISMSIGGPEPGAMVEEAIDHAIENGVIVVAAAGNRGLPMGWPADPTDPEWWFLDWPGAYPQVICVGSCGWGMGTTITEGTGEWEPWPQPRPRTWWYEDVPEDMEDEIAYISYFSGREYVNPAFPSYTVELDVVAPGSWVLGPYPGDTFGFQHLPWWSKGKGKGVPPTYWYVGGTSMATPHVSGVAALMLEADPTLTQTDVEAILKGTATALPTAISPYPFAYGYVRWPSGDIYAFLWAEDATGAGIIQADAAVAAATPP